MATYDIGSRSLIFKRISMFLQETYMSTLEVSDEYTLDLAKCIYEYLRDFYPSFRRYWLLVLSIPEDFLSTIAKPHQDVYYKKEYITSTNNIKVWTGKYIPATEYDSWLDNTYYIKGPECTISDIYAMGLQNGILGDGTITYNEIFPGIYTYELLGYTKNLEVPADIRKLTDEQKIYTLDRTVPFVKIFENPELTKLYQKYQTETDLRQSGQKTLSDREYSRLKERIDFIEDSRECFASVPDGSTTLSDTVNFVSDGLSWVNQYNIQSWPINESILQFLNPETVISETSDMDTIAQMQILASMVGYEPGSNIGLFDESFTETCQKIQEELAETDSRVLVTGYCDIFVERYLRSKNDVKVEVY